MKLHISMGNSKLGRISSVSLTPKISCPSNVPCSKECYAIKSYRLYPFTKRAWDENLEFAIRNQAKYFSEINEFLHSNKRNIDFFRWHVSGDILNQSYLNNMNNIACMNPDTKFLAFTKKHDLNFNGLNPNFVVVLSFWPSWGSLSMNTSNLPIAWMQDGTETRVREGSLECIGSCSNCGICWHLAELKRDVVFHKH